MGYITMARIVSQLTVPAPVPDFPSEWELYEVVRVNTTWTPPEENAWYRVHVFGKCGDGGNGTAGGSGGYGGAGGNSGGYASAILYGKDIIATACTIDSTITSFGSFLAAAAGGSASGRTVSSVVGIGTVGEGCYAPTYALSGYKGGAPQNAGGNSGAKAGSLPSPAWTDQDGDTRTDYDDIGTPGGGGARLPTPYTNFPYVPNNLNNYSGGRAGWAYTNYSDEVGGAASAGSSYPSVDLTAPMLYGGGNGGGGGAYSYTDRDSNGNGVTVGDPYHVYNGSGGAGSAGSPGLIIIERGVA